MSTKKSIKAEVNTLPSLTGHVGKKFEMVPERNVSDLIVKASAGFLLGTMASLILMKRKVYPVVIGTSFGCGASLYNYYKDINELQSAQDLSKHEEKPAEAIPDDILYFSKQQKSD